MTDLETLKAILTKADVAFESNKDPITSSIIVEHNPSKSHIVFLFRGTDFALKHIGVQNATT